MAEPRPAASDAYTSDVGLDPGHSRLDVGAAGGGLREYQVTLDVAGRVRSRLVARGVTVAMSRTGDEPISDWSAKDPTELIQREQEARIAAVGRARIYVSIHFNGIGDPTIAGTETYYNLDANGAESRRLALALQNGVVSSLAAIGYQSPNRGAKSDLLAGKPYGHFFSLRGPMPSALVESLFLTNPGEAALLKTDSARDAIASGIASGILSYLGR